MTVIQLQHLTFHQLIWQISSGNSNCLPFNGNHFGNQLHHFIYVFFFSDTAIRNQNIIIDIFFNNLSINRHPVYLICFLLFLFHRIDKITIIFCFNLCSNLCICSSFYGAPSVLISTMPTFF